MTYSVNGKIQATDFNGFRTLVNDVYADNNSGATAEGSANFGYGQTSIAAVSVGDKIVKENWNILFAAIRNCSTHQGSTITDLPAVDTDDPVVVIPTLVDRINTIRTNRLNLDSALGTVTSSTNTTASGNWDTTRTQTLTSTFTNWNAMRHFFNAGGEIRLSFDFDGTPNNTTESNWIAMSSAVDLVRVEESTTISNGGVGFGGVDGSGIGLYDFTALDQTIFSYTPSGYTSEQYIIEAKLNGAPGSATAIIFTLSFVTPAGGDIIDLTLNSRTANLNPSTTGVTIASPTMIASSITP